MQSTSDQRDKIFSLLGMISKMIPSGMDLLVRAAYTNLKEIYSSQQLDSFCSHWDDSSLSHKQEEVEAHQWLISHPGLKRRHLRS